MDRIRPADLAAVWEVARSAQAARFDTRHHGVEHWTRVERNGLWLAGQLSGVDRLVVRLFAALHDCQRRDDGHDPEHGPRAASFIADHLDLGLPGDRLEVLLHAIRTHTGGGTRTDDLTVKVCHDADRLDLGRVWIRPDPRFLHTEAARELARRDAVADLDAIALDVTRPEWLRPTPHWDR